MAQATAIGWTDLSWNPVHGCSIVSTECKHCYAAELSLRYGQTAKPWTPANAVENVTLKPHKLREPLSNAKPWRGLGAAAAAAGKTDGMLVFVNSMSDLFHEEIPDAYIAWVFAVMALAKRHTFQVLTKRPDRMRDLLGDVFFRAEIGAYLAHGGLPLPVEPWPLPNVWLGVSVGLRQFVRRVDVLRETPAAVRFISAEPLLGPLVCDGLDAPDGPRGYRLDHVLLKWSRGWQDGHEGPELDLADVDWLIVGGESGPDHRPMRLEWARDLRDACVASGTALFVKQLGGARPGTALEDLPEDLRSRDFPVPVGVRR